MPTIVFKTRIRTVSDNCTLELVVLHRIVAGEASAIPRLVNNPPPNDVDIVSVSPLTITTTGMLNNRRISAEDLVSSRMVQHLPQYLRLNSGELGFEVVSDAHIATDTGQLTFFCTASRPCCSLDIRPPRFKLLGFDIDYLWHEKLSPGRPESLGFLNTDLTPFSSCLGIPYLTALDIAVEKFVNLQMVRCYPRIFGSWSQQLDMEKLFVSSIYFSLNSILRRSPSLTFEEAYRTRFKIIEKELLGAIADRLSRYLDEFDANKYQYASPGDDEKIFIHAMEQAYCLAMRKHKFKGVSYSEKRLPDTDDLFCDQQPSFIGFEEELFFEASDEEDRNSCWSECADASGFKRNMSSPSLSEDLFASDFNSLDMPPESNQYLWTTDDDGSYRPDFSSILDTLAAESKPDYIPLPVKAPRPPHVDIFATEVPQFQTPTIVPALGLGSNGLLRFTSPGTEDQPLSKVKSSATKPSNGFTLSQGSKLVEDDCTDSPIQHEYSSGNVHLKSGQTQDAVSQYTFPVNRWDGVDFVAMEF